ncbi:MAG TPA: hypothetical protein VGO58_06170 [Chitinophagaceae bacterium]|nr:hypothetical protein [Chitinophagaceae bacterium]
MKKIFPGILLLFFLSPAISQDPQCPDLKARLETAEKEQKQILKSKAAVDYSLSLMEDEVPDMNGLKEELKNTENLIGDLQARVSGGAIRVNESAAELASLRNRADLLKIRMSKDFNKATFFSQPKFRQLEKDQTTIKSKELDINLVIADLEQKLKDYNCPGIAKKVTGEMEITTELEAGWAGNWKYLNTQEETKITLLLNGTGSSVAGTATFASGPASMVYQVKGCKETSPNRLSCNFDVTMDDYEKYMDIKGTVLMTQSGNILKTTWQQVGVATVRWKPGAKQREYIPKVPAPMNINFTRE